MPTIQNLAYKLVAVAGTYNVIPTDTFGNLLPQVVIDVDATLGDVIIELPEIATTFEGRYTTKIIVNRIDSTANAVRVIVDTTGTGNDLIGSATQVGLASAYDSIVLEPVSELGWSGSVTTQGLPTIFPAVAKADFALAGFIDLPLGTVILVTNYAGTGDGASFIKMTTTNGTFADWVVTATENAVSTGHIGQVPA
jgi:hypothetical protein